MRTTRNTLALVLALAMVGCGDDDTGTPDGGMTTPDGSMTTPDGSTPDGGPRPDGSTATGCDGARAVTLTEGEQTLTGDTTEAGSELALGDGCGGGASPQEVLALTLPGTGDVGVKLTTRGTEFDTVVQVRPAGCEVATDALCFDDISFFETQSAGNFVAEGGSTIYVVVTGYDDTAFGAWTMSIETVVNPSAPVLTGGEALLVDGARLDLSLMGSDADGDVLDIGVSYLDAAGAVIAIDADGDPETPAVEEEYAGFVEDLEGMTTFTGTSRIGDRDELPELAAVAGVRVKIYDELLLESATMDFPIVRVTESAFGEACVEGVSICELSLDCIAAVCAVPTATVTACEAATPLALTPGTETVITASVPVGDGLVGSICGDTAGAEALYEVTIPSKGTFDLLASAVRPANAPMLDTVIYAQTRCGDPGPQTEPSCNDDVEGAEDDYRSSLELRGVTAGTYTLAVEIWGGAEAATDVEVGVTLRPVLGAGESCDLAGLANRCSTGACAGTPAVCPPAP